MDSSETGELCQQAMFNVFGFRLGNILLKFSDAILCTKDLYRVSANVDIEWSCVIGQCHGSSTLSDVGISCMCTHSERGAEKLFLKWTQTCTWNLTTLGIPGHDVPAIQTFSSLDAAHTKHRCNMNDSVSYGNNNIVVVRFHKNATMTKHTLLSDNQGPETRGL